jgi:hypothetical protein
MLPPIDQVSEASRGRPMHQVRQLEGGARGPLLADLPLLHRRDARVQVLSSESEMHGTDHDTLGQHPDRDPTFCGQDRQIFINLTVST